MMSPKFEESRSILPKTEESANNRDADINSDPNFYRIDDLPSFQEFEDGFADLELLEFRLVQDAFAISTCGLDESGLERFLVASWAYFLKEVESEEFDERIAMFLNLVKVFLRSLYARKVPELAGIHDEVLTVATKCIIQNLMEMALREPSILFPSRLFRVKPISDGRRHLGDEYTESCGVQQENPWQHQERTTVSRSFDDRPKNPKKRGELPTIPRRPSRSLENMDGPQARLATQDDLFDIISTCQKSNEFCLPGTYPIFEVTDDTSPGAELRIGQPMTIRFGDKIRARHQLFIGPTGVGKTTTCALMRLASDIADPSQVVVVLDSKGGELLPYIEQLMVEFRPESQVTLIDFLQPDRSMAWNPLDSLKTHADFFAFAERFCRAAEAQVVSSDSQFWIQSSIQFLCGILWALHNDSNERCTLSRAREVTDMPLSELKLWAKKYARVPGLQTMVEFLDTGAHNAFTIAMDLRNRLALFIDDRIARLTSNSEVRFAELLTTPSVVVLRVNEVHAGRLKPLTNAFFAELCAQVFERAETCNGGRLPFPVSLVIEEFASAVGRIPDFGAILNVIRARGVSVCASVQSIGQIENEYGGETDPVLVGFGTKIFFPGVSMNDAEYASRLFGTTSVEFHEKRVTKDSYEAYSSNVSESEAIKVMKRPILTPHEIRNPSPCSGLVGPVTFDVPGIPAFQAYLTPVYSLAWFSKICDVVAGKDKLGKEREKLLPSLPERSVAIETNNNHSPTGIRDTLGWDDEKVREELAAVKKLLDWDNTVDTARRWWEAFENENNQRLKLVFRLTEELRVRKATIAEFFQAYVDSNTDNIQANLHYLDYTSLKKEEDRKKKDAARSVATNAPDLETSSSNTCKSDSDKMLKSRPVGDSLELTFVRCRSCRSLIPAMSTCCHICGASSDDKCLKTDL